MEPRRDMQFFCYVTAVAFAWIPIATWLMPRVASAPVWDDNPGWYLSSAVMAIVLAYLLRFLMSRFSSRSASSQQEK